MGQFPAIVGARVVVWGPRDLVLRYEEGFPSFRVLGVCEWTDWRSQCSLQGSTCQAKVVSQPCFQARRLHVWSSRSGLFCYLLMSLIPQECVNSHAQLISLIGHITGDSSPAPALSNKWSSFRVTLFTNPYIEWGDILCNLIRLLNALYGTIPWGKTISVGNIESRERAEMW